MRQRRLQLLASFNWFLLSFIAGTVNAGGFLACGRFVSHVTGFATLFGVDLARGALDHAVGILSVPVFFLGGGMISAYLIDRPYHQGRNPHYAIVMSLVAACLFLAAILGAQHAFGTFGEDLLFGRDYSLLALLCLASGLQNAAITTSSGAAVRTTHLTGITTDLAIGLVRAHAVQRNRARFIEEMRVNYIRIGTITSFVLGSVIGVALYLRLEYLGFLFPAFLALYEVIIAFRYRELFEAKIRFVRGTQTGDI